MGDLIASTGAGDPTPVPGAILAELARASGDIRRTLLKGRVAPGQQFSGNFVECRFEDVDFSNVDLRRCDWKDCHVYRVVFDQCDLGHASFMTNHYRNCRFIRCRFPDTSINDSVFESCEFLECDLKDVVVKASRFEGATFDRCTTSNRVIESSLLLDTAWRSMNIDVRLITGNFGLLRSNCATCTLVAKEADGHIVAKSWVELRSLVEASEPTAIEFLRFRHFETEDLETDALALDRALDLATWTKDAVVQASFSAQLSSFAQFLLALFELNQLPIYPILILHSRNFELLNWLEHKPEGASLYQAVAGIHWVLTKDVQAFTRLLEDLKQSLLEVPTLHFAAEGPASVDYFNSWLTDLGLKGVSVDSVRPRNSPVDLALMIHGHPGLAALLAWFLATRTKIELSKISIAGKSKAKSKSESERPVLALSAGFLPTKEAEYELSIQALLPHSLMLNLQLTLNVAVFQRARRTLIELLTPVPSAPAEPQKHQPELPPPSPRSRRK